MPRKGRNFEKLTQALEKYLAGTDTVVESPGFVKDRVTGQSREIDVLITRGEGHHKQLIAIECRDRKAPVGGPDIEAFFAKTNDLKINKAVFVSSSGFRKKAITKAQFYNISCLDLDEVDEFDWLLTNHIIFHETKLLKSNWKINTDNEDAKSSGNLMLMTTNGELITNDVLAANAKRLLNSLDLSKCEPNTVYGDVFPVLHDNLIITEKNTNQEYPVSEFNVYIEFIKIIKEIPFKRIKYGDVTEGTDIAKAAIAEIDFGNKEGHLMVVEQEDGSKQLVLTTNKKG